MEINIKGETRMIILLFFLAFCQTVYSQQKPDRNKSDAINKALSEIVNLGQAPGMIAAIISREGVMAIGFSGVRKAGSGVPITSNDLVHLGSCTKAMTAVMLTTLVEEGKLDEATLVRSFGHDLGRIWSAG